MIKTTTLLTLTLAAGATAWWATPSSDPEPDAAAGIADAAPEPTSHASEESEPPKAKAKPQPKPDAEAKAPDENEARWRKTRERLSDALEETPPVPEPKAGSQTRLAYARLIIACVRDIEDQPAQFSVKLTEVGAPDIGTIVSEVEVVGTSVDNPEIVECAEQSMYAYLGDPPEEPYERSYRFGMRMPAKKKAPEHDGKVFRYNMNKRLDDVRACVPEGTKGFVELEVIILSGASSPEAVTVKETDVDESIGTCIRDTVLGWSHFTTIEGEARRHRYTLPLPKAEPEG